MTINLEANKNMFGSNSVQNDVSSISNCNAWIFSRSLIACSFLEIGFTTQEPAGAAEAAGRTGESSISTMPLASSEGREEKAKVGCLGGHPTLSLGEVGYLGTGPVYQELGSHPTEFLVVLGLQLLRYLLGKR